MVQRHNETLPLVSVLMTAYNREKYISEAIESVIAQSFKDWELIITDDKSTDNTVAIAQSYANKDNRIKVYLNENNLGDYPNRNQAASYARGKYIKYLDADDILYTWALETFVSSMESYPQAGWGVFFSNNPIKRFPYLLNCSELYEKHYSGEMPILSRSPLSVIIKTEAFKAVGGFTGKQHIGDFEMWHLLGMHYPMVAMAGALGWWRQHENQQMNDNRVDPFVEFKYLQTSIELLSSKDCPMDPDLARKYKRDIKQIMGRRIMKMVVRRRYSKANEMLKYSDLNLCQAFRYALSSIL